MAPLLIIQISTRYSSVTFGWPQDLTTESSYIIYCLQVYLNWFRLLLVYFTTYPFYTYRYFIVHIVIFTHCSHTFLSINMQVGTLPTNRKLEQSLKGHWLMQKKSSQMALYSIQYILHTYIGRQVLDVFSLFAQLLLNNAMLWNECLLLLKLCRLQCLGRKINRSTFSYAIVAQVHHIMITIF